MDNNKEKITTENLPEVIRNIISQHLRLYSTDYIQEETHLINDLRMDSFKSVAIFLDIEEALGMEIPDNDVEKLYTFQQIIEYLKKRIEENK